MEQRLNMDGLWGLQGGTTVRSSSTRSLRESREDNMRRFRTLLLGGLMMVALLIERTGTAAAARPSVSGISGATGWLCTPHGSGGLAPTTYISSALIFQNNMSRSTITCFFQNIGGPTSTISGPGSLIPEDCCQATWSWAATAHYNAGQSIGVEFRHRIYTVFGNTAQLVCWDGFFECMDSVVAPSASICEASAGSVSRRLRF